MIKLFPTLIHEFKIPDFRQETLLRYCYEERDKNIEGVYKSNRGGWQSQDHYCLFNNPINTALRLSLSDWVNNSNTFEKGTQMEVQAMWININGNGSYNMKHNHPNSDMSGVFWISTPEDSGQLVFESPNAFGQNRQISKYSNDIKSRTNAYPAFDVDPHEGTIMFFPASLYHSVTVNKCKHSRISAGFNLNFV